ncbi:uncharacterized protein LOC123293052 [Chrysoperla carnea]|uniref:uncharacterized protein LOC123293052 n=1 Tax=Chrysoperla carnea TaxID=189513 RepID=UPI001D05CC41|nr:uncharacterized protein LOC123293052 [Chrysoperla carnea]
MTKSSCLQCRLISSSNVVPSDENEATASFGKATKDYLESTSQSLIVLLIMIAVLLFILTYCLWGTPWCRYFCRRRLFPCFYAPDDMTISSGSVTPRTYSSTGGVNNSRAYRGAPTIILLPQGRMLVVDGSIIAQFRADTQGVDLMELGQSIAWQRHQSTPSILSSGTTDSKDGLNQIIPLTRFSPPSYESLFGNQAALESVLYDLPPSYSEINFQLQQLNNAISREFSSLSNGQRQRTFYTSETNLSRAQNTDGRRYRSADLLENHNETERNNGTSTIISTTLNVKQQSEGDIIDSTNILLNRNNQDVSNRIVFRSNPIVNLEPFIVRDISMSQQQQQTINSSSNNETAQINNNAHFTINVENSNSSRTNESEQNNSDEQRSTITSSRIQFDENIRESRV